MNKKKSLKAAGIIAVVIIVLAAGFGGWYFMAGSNAYQDVFYPGTTLNKMDIEGLTVDQAREKLEDSVKDYSLTISFKNAQCRISGQDIQMACNDKADIQALKDQQNKVRYNKTDKDALALTVKDLFTYDSEALTNQLKQCDALDEEKMIEPENAVLVYDKEKNSFSLRNGEQGTKMIFSEVLAAAEEALEENLSELDAEDAGLYQTAALTEESPKAADVLKEADDYLKLHLEYTFSKDGKDKKEIIDSKLVSEWLYVDDNGDVQADHDQIQAWVNDMADEYNSDKVSMQFTTTSGSEISLKVPVGGEAIDTSALFKDVVKCLEDKVSGDRKVPHTEKASGISQNFGGNYVEVNLTDQKLYLYKKGELIMSSNIVSGSVSKSHMTPTGVYKVYSMEKNTVLRGADYASPVSFWMPFNGGVGFHDATWRSSFGGTINQYNGSHGCINMPYDKAKTLYENTIQVIMLLSMAVLLMCRDRQRTEVHLQAAVPRVTRRMTETTGKMTRRRKRRRKAIKRQRKRRRKQRNIQRQRNRRQLHRRRRNLKQVHLKLLRQKRRLLRPVRRIQKHLRRIRLKQVHRNRNQSRNQSRKPRRKGWWMLSLYPAYNR